MTARDPAAYAAYHKTHAVWRADMLARRDETVSEVACVAAFKTWLDSGDDEILMINDPTVDASGQILELTQEDG